MSNTDLIDENSERWPIRDVFRDAVVKRLVRIITDPNSEASDVIAASRALMTAEAQNQKDERDNDPTKRIAGYLALAKQLGIEPPAPGRIEG